MTLRLGHGATRTVRTILQVISSQNCISEKGYEVGDEVHL